MDCRNPSPNVHRFFKVMFGRDIHKHLYLPPRFSRLMGHFDGEETIIEDFTGLRWPVTLSQVDGSLAFHKGWAEFFDAHGLKQGHFLAFSFTHVGHFHVHVYGESAFEITNFDKSPTPGRSTSLRTNQDTVHVNYGDTINAMEKPSSSDSISSRSEFRNSEKVMSMDMDPSLMINRRDDSCYQGEGRSILYDLSCFEMQKKIPRPTNSVQMSKDASTTKICFEKLDKAPESNVSPSHCVQMGHVKMSASRENQKIDGNSGDGLAAKLEKASDKGIDQTRMTAIHSEKLNGNSRDILTNKFVVKPSDNSNSSEPVIDSMYEIQNALSDKLPRISESPCMGRNMIAERREPESSVSSLLPKRPFGQPAVKNEQVMFNIAGSRVAPSHCVQMGHMKMASSCENQNINGNPGDGLADKLEKASDKGIDQTRMTGIQSEKLNANSRDILTNKFAVKPSDNSNLSEPVMDSMYEFQKASSDKLLRVSESPYMGGSMIGERREYVVKRRCPESSVFSLLPKRPFGQPAIKSEHAMLDIAGTGQKPISATEDGMLNLQPVKVEPDLPSISFSPFSVEVKSQSYLELPVHIPSAQGRRNSGRGKVVYLRDATGRLWPILYPDLFTVKAFTGNWTRFCKHNSIMPGDECRFQLENGKMCAYRVDVIRSHRD